MSNRTWACVPCRKTFRRDFAINEVPCSLCRAPCESVHTKIRLPSPTQEKEWDAFWTKYRDEKNRLTAYFADDSIKEITLELLNQTWRRP